MKEPENIRAVAALQPDYMGFIFYEGSPRFVDENTVKSMLPELERTGIETVAVLVNASLERANEICQYGFHTLQLHGQESPEYCAELADKAHIIKAFGLDEHFDFDLLKAYEPVCDYFLFDTKSPQHGGTGKQFDWSLLNNYTGNKPYFLSGGIDAVAIRELKATAQCHALDLNSKFEQEPGKKDALLLKEAIIGLRL